MVPGVPWLQAGSSGRGDTFVVGVTTTINTWSLAGGARGRTNRPAASGAVGTHGTGGVSGGNGLSFERGSIYFNSGEYTLLTGLITQMGCRSWVMMPSTRQSPVPVMSDWDAFVWV